MESQRIGEPVADRRFLAFGDHSYCRNLLVRSARFPRIITSPLPSHSLADGEKSKSKQSPAPAATASSELKRWTRRNIWLNPVLVLPGWPIELPRAETSVVVLNEETETEFFVSHSRVPSHDQILEICSHLDRSARS